MLNGDVWIGLVYTPVAQVHINGLRPHASGLHQDAGLFHLLLQGVSVIGVAALSFGDALHLGRVPAVELGLFVQVLQHLALFGVGLFEGDSH